MKDKWTTLRQQHILEAAATLFADKGFHQTTIRDIATAAGVADGTIYNYFENKHAILIALFEQLRTAVVNEPQWQALPPGNIDILLEKLIEQPLNKFGQDHKVLFQIIVTEMLVDETIRHLYQTEILQPTLALAETILQSWVDNGDLKPIDVPLTVRIISALLNGLTLHLILGDDLMAERWTTLPSTLTALLLNGLRSET